MAANKHSDQGEGHGHGVAAQPDYVSARMVVGFAIILIVLAVASMALIAGLFRVLDSRAEKKDAASLERAGLEARPVAPPQPPRLQVYAVRHWNEFREAEAKRLESYGWMDRTTGAVHIPIQRAMDLVAERGVGPLPAAPMAMPAPAATSEVKP